jgi:tetratricopeptide (TPR) repeat protein
MIARKLSQIARCATGLLVVAGITQLAVCNLRAQDAVQVATPVHVVENPFASTSQKQQPRPRVVAEERPELHRRPITYQNPFAAMSKSPPVDTSLRPGPVSRWQHPTLRVDETSPIKSAVVSTQPWEPHDPSWNQLPPAEELRRTAASRGPETDPTFYSRLIASPDPIQLAPTPLTQPTWITAGTDQTRPDPSSPLHVDPAIFDAPLHAPSNVKQVAATATSPQVPRSGRVENDFIADSHAPTSAKADMSPAIVSNLDSPEGWLDQAQQAAEKASSPGELSAVIGLCDRGMRAGPNGKISSSLRRLAAWAYNRRGELRADAGRADDALDDFQVAISLDPKCSLAIHNRAVTFAQQKQYAAALRDFNRVIELNPGLAVAYRNRAELLAALGRMDEAVADYTQAMEGLPNDAALYRGRGYAYHRLGDFSKSLADFNRAIEIAPNDPDALTQRGNLAAEQGHYDQALTDYRRALARDPNWSEAHRGIAWLDATCPNPNFQNPQDAIAEAQQAAKLTPTTDYVILDTLAAAHASARQFEKAVEIEQEALKSAPPELVPSLEQRLALYRHGQPYQNAPPSARTNARPEDTPTSSSHTNSSR